ncbi:MAG: universal stress protein [Cyanobacteria bacterium P01_C01_bin.120]
MFRVLLPVDINQLESRPTFIDRAIRYVKAFEGQFIVMTIMADYSNYFVSPLLPENFIDKAKAKALESLETFTQDYIPEDLVSSFSVRHGSVHDEILAVAKEEQVDLIFLCTDRPEPVDYLLGTVAGRVIRHAPCDVVFLHSGQ